MSVFTTIKLAFRALWRNKVRTVLTMLGIVFGIGAVISMVAFGQGAQASVKDVSRLTRSQLADVRGRMIGFVFQSFNLLSRTTALENVVMPLMYQGIPGRERHKRALHALERVGLADRADHHPNQLSGGQQQRVAIARALVCEAPIIMADEPTGNLDTKTSYEVMSILQGLVEQGITVILVTHEPDIAAYAARVVTLRDGVIIDDRRQTPVKAEVAA